MKVTKDAATAGKRLYRLCAAGGRLDEDKLRTVMKALVERKPRNYQGILATLHRQVRLDLAQRHVVVESSQQLDEATGQSITSKMISQHGEGLTFEYKITIVVHFLAN